MTEIDRLVPTETALLAATSGIRRALRRRVGKTGRVAELSEAQRELVRTVRRHPGIRVGEAAADLHLAGNTVSTLVSVLCATGWLEREPDPADRRSALLFLTPAAERRVAQWRDRRSALLNEALARLDEAQRRQIEAALPALGRLVDLLMEDE